MRRTKKICTWLVVGILALSTAAWAAPGRSFTDLPVFQKWLETYDKENGDHAVLLRLQPSRFFLTEKTDMRGLVELDLIDGKVLIELYDLDREVDVWALDNAVNTGILPGDEGDRLIRLARLAPGEDGAARVEKVLGPEAFRGFELDWIFVSDAGKKPNDSRLLFSTRGLYERLYTKKRLALEGYDKSIPPRQWQSADKAGVGIATKPHIQLVIKGLVTQEQFDGAGVFFRETFEGNGRSCGTCHPAENNQTIDVPFIAGLDFPDDPLFIATQRGGPDACTDDNDKSIACLEEPALLSGHGLIVENVDGREDPARKFVMRSVPHSLSLETSTKPDDGLRTGWSGDGAPNPGKLIDFLLGAIIQHYPTDSLDRVFGTDFREPSDEELLLTEIFMLGVGRTNDIDLSKVMLSNPDADSGRGSFMNSGCNACHFNAGANFRFSPNPPENRNFQTNVELLPNPAQGTVPAPLLRGDYPVDGGFGPNDPALNDCNFDDVIDERDGFGDCFFNSTPLIEAADTAPFFHNNTAATIEDAVTFYSGPPFTNSNNPVFPGDPVTQNKVAAFLRVMNASFNIQIALQRNEAALVLTPGPRSLPGPDESSLPESNGVKATANKLLDLSNDELEDALPVLTGGPLGNLDPNAVGLIDKAIGLNKRTIDTTSNSKRRSLIIKTIELLKTANNSLGTDTGFIMGAGNLLF